MNDLDLKRAFLILLIVSVAVSAAIGIGVFLFGDFGYYEIRIMMTTLTVTVTSIVGLACGACLESGRGQLLPIAGIIFSVAAAVMTFLIIWNVLDRSEDFIRATATVTLLALSCSHLSLLSLARLDRRFAWSRIFALVCVGLLLAILLYLIWTEPDPPGDLVIRVVGILSILVAAVTVITPVFHKLSGSESAGAEIEAEIEKLKGRIAELEKRKSHSINMRR